jgi:coenzyme PQQ precursor peptide PqqA
MSSSWETPDFEEIDVGSECTAYAGATTDGETTAGAGPGAAPLIPTAPLREPTTGR